VIPRDEIFFGLPVSIEDSLDENRSGLAPGILPGRRGTQFQSP
jgi:hypothetical protein